MLVNNAISAGGTAVGSSIQIKENIVDYPADEAYFKLMAIRPKHFTYKKWWLDYVKQPNATVGGFIAEQIEIIDPTLVARVQTNNLNLIDGKLVTF